MNVEVEGKVVMYQERSVHTFQSVAGLTISTMRSTARPIGENELEVVKMKREEIEFLMRQGMISVEDDNIDYVIEALRSNGFEVK